MATGQMSLEDAFLLLRKYPDYKEIAEDEWNRTKPAVLMTLITDINTNVSELGFSLNIVKDPLNDDTRCVVWSATGASAALQDTSAIDVDGGVVMAFLRDLVTYVFDEKSSGGMDTKGVFVRADECTTIMAKRGKIGKEAMAMALLCEEGWVKPGDAKKFYFTIKLYKELKGYMDLDRPREEMNDRLDYAKSKAS